MNKMEYLSKLRDCLSALPPKERDAAVKYYDDLFTDAGEVNEQSVISGLGSPQRLAHTILNDNNGISYELSKTRKEVKAVKKKLSSRQTALAVFLIILTSPIWGSILLGILGVILGIFAAGVVSLIAFVTGGIVLLCMGAAYIARTVSIALVLAGTGISLISLAFLLFTPVMNLVFLLIKLIIKGCIRLLNKILGKTEVKA
jgi:uncharacterized membrane protein